MDELTEWVKSDDDRSRTRRARRHRELLELLPMPPEGLSFSGGDESVICLEEIRLCYVQGLDLAVVLLCLAYVEREVAANLYSAGWNGAKNAALNQLLERGLDDGLLTGAECRTDPRPGGCEELVRSLPSPPGPIVAVAPCCQGKLCRHGTPR